jgi:nucleoside phosphorylase
MRILFIAADRREFRGVLRRSGETGATPLDVNWARTARLNAHEVLLAANGAGTARAASAADAALKAFPAEAIVSTGFCGAVDPLLEVADVVVATFVAAGERRYPALPASSASAFRQGLVRTLDHVAQTAGEKQDLRAAGVCAVEMEAAGVAARAQDAGLPFYCIRAVTDLAGETMANDFNNALRPNGRFDTISILGSSLRHPAARLPELFRLRSRCDRASRALGDFLADCRF